MAQAQLIEEEIPAGGIADFIMTDAEIADLEKEEAKEAFGSSGIANFEDVAKRMASYGRHGDDKVAHVETGELLVPRALIEGNPELKESIFGHLREMGVENPERYVVGSGENSINPDTGLPEFFFKSIRRAVSKIGKSVSKAVSKVGKVLKKVAPAILPIALAMTPLGPMYGAALGSGIGTLIQGGNIKDALKSALTAGAIGGITAGFTGKGSFMSNIGDAMKNPMARLSQTGAGISKAFETGSISEAFQSYQVPGSEIADDIAAGRAGAGEAEAQALQKQLANADRITPQEIVADATKLTSPPPPPTETAGSGFVDSVKEAGQSALDFLNPNSGMPTSSDIAQKAQELMTANSQLGSAEATALATNELTPGFIARYGPLAVAGTGAAALGGFFEAAPQEDPNLVDQRTGADLIAENPEEYRLSPEARTPSYAQGPFTVGTEYGLPSFLRQGNPFVRPQMYAAEGGQVFPRRTGGIMPNEGIPDQDSVRALLMPGEFVMTKNAVKGLGNGSMTQGINNMYSMMRNLEAKGQVA